VKRSSTLLLKVIVILIGLPILTLALIGIPWLIKNPVNPDYAYILYPIVAGLYLTTFPFFTALYQAIKVLKLIDKRQAFSDLSVDSLKVIKNCAFIICGLHILMSPFFYLLSQIEDAPGVMLISVIFIFASFVIGMFTAVLQLLLKEAVDIKADNDLTI
jgi:hypothetical protein